MRPLLFTSIPPRLRGVTLESDRADAPQVAVIRSWARAGFQPVSVNMEHEVAGSPRFREALAEYGVESVVLTSSAARAARGPLCPLLDFLRAIRHRADDASIAVVNADIRLASAAGEPLAALVRDLAPGEHLVAQRTDISPRADGRRRETVHPHGFDFLAFHGSWIDRVDQCLSPALEFGLPWWDHYLPLALIAFGCRTRLVHPGWCLHEAHAERWSRRHYCGVGRLAMRHFLGSLARASDPAPSRAWIDMVDLEAVPGGITGPLADRVRRIATHDFAPDFVAVRILGRLAAANVRLVLESATSGPEPPGAIQR